MDHLLSGTPSSRPAGETKGNDQTIAEIEPCAPPSEMAAFFVPLDELSDRQTRITGWRGRLADDREIWKRISQGDADSFDAFYRENAPRLQVFLRHVTGNPQAAEDISIT
jgi:hypothetical protein